VARRWKAWALVLGALTLGAAIVIAGPGSATSWPPALAPLSDEDLLAFSLSIQDCIGVVEVLRRTPDAGQDGEYVEYLDVRPLRWFSGTCGGTTKLRLYSLPHSGFGFMSTGDWEVGPRDTVIVVAYRDKSRSVVSQTTHTLWQGLARATPERIQFLDSNVPRILESQTLSQLTTRASTVVTARFRRVVECRRNGTPTRCTTADVVSLLAGKACGDSIVVFDPFGFRPDTTQRLLFLAEPESCLYRVIGWTRGSSPIVDGKLPALDGRNYEDVVAAVRAARQARPRDR
jgi:hypothetical protein